MIRSSLVITLFSFVLTACGGGGGATLPGVTPQKNSILTSPSGFAQPAQLNGNFHLARLDYRYDTGPTELNSNGQQTTSYDAVKPMIDQMVTIGFTGVIFQLETPINATTGMVSFNDVPGSVKTPPKALWQLVDYAKSQNLKVWLSMGPVDSISDCQLTPDFTKYSEQFFFDNIINYMRPLASQAQTHQVDGIYVGEGLYALESSQHLSYWAQLIGQVRSVFYGKLSYSTFLGADTPIWSYVDYPTVTMSSPLSNTPVTNDLLTITKLFLNDALGNNEVNQIKKIFNTYNKKVILTENYMGADIGVNNTPSTFFDSMLVNFAVASTQPVELVNNQNLKVLKMQAFLEITGLQLSDIVIGNTFTEFAPWLMNSHFSDPSSQNQIYKYYCCGWELSTDKTIQQTLNSYFSQPWNYHSLNSIN